jgi:uncharacterized membrane protein
MATYESSVVVRATPQQVFAVYADAESWPRWDPDLESATRRGPFAVGSTGEIKPREGPRTKIRISRIDRDLRFDAEAKLPMCIMRFEHIVEAVGVNTRVTHRVVLEGPLKAVYAKLIGKKLAEGIPRTMAGLKSFLERGSR